MMEKKKRKNKSNEIIENKQPKTKIKTERNFEFKTILDHAKK